jgi:hypothetical protein
MQVIPKPSIRLIAIKCLELSSWYGRYKVCGKKLATYKMSMAFAGIWPGNPLIAIMSAIMLRQNYRSTAAACIPRRLTELITGTSAVSLPWLALAAGEASTKTVFGFEGYGCLFRLPSVLYTIPWIYARITRSQVSLPERR